MRAVRFEGGGVQVVDAPRATGEGVRVDVRGCGICGSDLKMLDGGFPMAGIPGHEIAGVLADGTPVAIEPLAPCGRCEFCAAGDYQICRSGPAMIFGVGRDGGMAEEIVVPERCLVPLPRGIPVADACLVEPLAVAVHGLRRAGIHGAQRVCVVGGGGIGLCAVAAARGAGCEVGLVARHEAQVAAGERLGAVVPDGEYDVVLDCAGTPGSAEEACERLRPGGAILMLATAWGDMTLPGIAMGAKEVTLVSSAMYGRGGAGRDVEIAAALLATRPEIPRAIITHRFPLEAAPEAFDTARDRKAGAIKVVVEP